MYIVKPDGAILCETADEALSLQAKILEKKYGTAAQPPAKRQLKYVKDDPEQNIPNGNNEDAEFLRRLSEHVGKTLDAEAIAQIAGSGDAAGAGAKIHWIGRRMAKHGRDIKEYLRQEKNGGKVHWTVLKGLSH